MGGAVAEWAKALLVRENKRKTKKIPGSPPPPGHLLKKCRTQIEKMRVEQKKFRHSFFSGNRPMGAMKKKIFFVEIKKVIVL